MTKNRFAREILLLQGGGALGAYHAGVCDDRISNLVEKE